MNIKSGSRLRALLEFHFPLEIIIYMNISKRMKYYLGKKGLIQ